jgi:DNA-binding response OmpR family regulator
MNAHSFILLIEDSPGECELFQMALRKTGLDIGVYVEQDAEAAMHFLCDRVGHRRLPAFVLLDWHLHGTRGDRFLRQLRSDSRFASLPTIVFTTSDDSSVVTAGFGCGANSYVVKPSTFDELVRCISDLCCYWIKWNHSPPMAGI